MFTCLSCQIAFSSDTEHRTHYRSDLHRYNLKRRVAALPPVSQRVFTHKRDDRTHPQPVQSQFDCLLCGKTYASKNAHAAHLASRKHRENALKPASRTPLNPVAPVNPSTTTCLFCTLSSPSLDGNLAHMSVAHSFFIPDADYLVDLPGLVLFLAEKIAERNVCIYCNGKGRELRSLDAVRKHMLDKGHCKIAYDSEIDKLEIADYYDFTPSYPPDPAKNDDEAWEDVHDDDDGDNHLPENKLAYGDTEYELVLPSGARIGHRSLMRYYAQSFHGVPAKQQDPNSGAALVRRLLADKHSDLIPRKGGFGAFGQGTQVVKARNRGEAREAGRHVREYRDQRRREEFKTKVGFIHNSQKHFRDPLLQ